MINTMYGIGNPLVDYITEVDDEILKEFDLKKGYFHLFDKDKAQEILEKVDLNTFRIMPGGACANTACGIARMGGQPFFSGGIGDDDFGKIFRDSLDDTGVYNNLKQYDDPTGFVVSLVTPDAERTFVVYLGSSLLLEESGIDYNMLNTSTFLYFTGYQFEPHGLRKVITAASHYCRKTLTRVVMDLGDPGIVERNRDEIKSFVKENVDVLFANEEEGRNYTDEEGKECLKAMAEDTEYAVLKLGAKGSMIAHDEKVFEIPPYHAQPVDTTGAGDIYAAGVLAGLDRGYSVEYTGKMGSYAASLVVSQNGARLDKNIRHEIENL